ncbi:response regulator [Georgenia yuyongxinii]|uniref:Response regulator transcription factor n=1 Tax=Georgenia yuyongxinii TaxID=2589797 RepID=A0A552WLB3_9MICO|nr:response regulator transcription factor [Georgenia yuyongxinii]TRW43526.1 response regulator transcription factor [Georgenia yuyongxinii]
MKVLVVDDNPIVRLGVRAALEQVEEVGEVCEAADGRAAVDAVAADPPDVVLLDVRMPRMSGLEVLDVIAASTPTLMLTHSEDPEIVREALRAGARGYLVHGEIGPRELAGALRTCLSGGLVLSRQATGVMAVTSGGPTGVNPLRAALTEREAEVLEAAAQGLSNDEIARAQFLAPRTVKNYLNATYPKLGVHNRAEAIVAWLDAEAGRGPDQGRVSGQTALPVGR